MFLPKTISFKVCNEVLFISIHVFPEENKTPGGVSKRNPLLTIFAKRRNKVQLDEMIF